jgi:hypothetical protein
MTIKGQEFTDKTITKITKDFKPQEESIFAKPNVVGIGYGTKLTGDRDTGEDCVKVLVSQKIPKQMASEMLTNEELIPQKVGGTVTDVEEVGEILAGMVGIPQRVKVSLPEGETEASISPSVGQDLGIIREIEAIEGEDIGALTLRWRVRPVKGGYSCGHYKITAGTYATAVYDAKPYPGIPSKYYVLSNNHVLANSNDARVGDPILQPGPYDGGRYPQDTIARLSRWVPIHFLPSQNRNYVDAAIAEGPFNLLDREIYWIGQVNGVRNNWPDVKNKEILQKTGRTTNWSTGRTIAINATVNVGYGGGRVARFYGQIVTERMGGPGDSGSLVLDLNRNAIGLLFAGSSTHTIINHLWYVRQLLGIRVAE